MRRFAAVFLATLLLGLPARDALRRHADTDIALAAFQPDAPRPEAWVGNTSRAAACLAARLDDAPDDPGRERPMRALAFLARSGEPAALARLMQQLDAPSPATRQRALFALAWVYLPENSHARGLAGIDWTAFCLSLRSLVRAAEPAERRVGMFAYHCAARTVPERVGSTLGSPPIPAGDLIEALAAARTEPPPFPDLGDAWPLFLVQSLRAAPLDTAQAERFLVLCREILHAPDAAGDDLPEAVLGLAPYLSTAAAQALIALALDHPRLSERALALAAREPVPAYLSGYLSLLFDSNFSRPELVVRQLVALARRYDDAAVGAGLVARLKQNPHPEHGSDVYQALFEVLGDSALEAHLPADIPSKGIAVAESMLELLGRTGSPLFLDRLRDAALDARSDRVASAALRALETSAPQSVRAQAMYLTVLETLSNTDGRRGAPRSMAFGRLLDQNRPESLPALVRMLDAVQDPEELGNMVGAASPWKARRTIQSALAPRWVLWAAQSTSSSLQKHALADLMRFRWPPEAAPFAARFALAGDGERAEAMQDLLWVGSLPAEQVSVRVGRLLDSGSKILTAYALRALADLPIDDTLRARLQRALVLPDPYVNWRAALVLLRHGSLANPALVLEPFGARLVSPLAGESVPLLLAETIECLHKAGDPVLPAPECMERLLRGGSQPEAGQAADALIRLGTRRAADLARKALDRRKTCLGTIAESARILAHIGDGGDLPALVRCCKALPTRFADRAWEGVSGDVVGAIESLARPGDEPTLIPLLAEALPAAAQGRILRLLEALSGELASGDLPSQRRAWLARQPR